MMIGQRVQYQTGISEWGTGIVENYDMDTDMITVIDDDDGSKWKGSIDKIEVESPISCHDDAILCEQYNVAIYKVGEIWQHDENSRALAECEMRQYCVSVPFDSPFSNTLLKAIPLSEKYIEAQAVAVQWLGLRHIE